MFLKRWKVFLGLSLAALPAALFLASCSSQSVPSSGVVISPPQAGVFGPGAIAFTGLTFNGNSQFSFISTVSVSSGTTIFFTNESYDGTLNNGTGGLVNESTTASASSTWTGTSPATVINWESMATTVTEGVVAYIPPAGGLAPYTQVVIASTGNELQGGNATNISGGNGDSYLIFNHNGAGQKVLAFSVSAGVTTWLGAIIFGPDTWWQSIDNNTPIPQYNFWDSYLPPGLNTVYTSIDLSSLWVSDGLSNDNNSSDQNDNAVLDSCQNTLVGIVNPNNWIADGNESKSKVSLNPITGLSTQCSVAGYTGNLP